MAKTREGKPFSRVQLEEDLKAIEDYLILQGYLRCNVSETVRYPDDENGVSLAVFIATREHTQIEFEGIEVEREELAFLPIFSQRGTAPFFLEATRKELRQKYQEEGYFLAQVEYETSGPSREPTQVVITVVRGQSFNLKKIRFEGNHFAAAGSLKKLLTVEEEGVFSRGKFSTKMAEEDANSIRRYHQGRGYKDVQVTHALVLEGSDSRDLTLVYKIEEGPLYLIDTVHFIGNEYLSTKTLFEEIQGHPGTPFSPFLVAQDRANIMAAYANRGYRQTGFRSEIIYPEPGRVNITYFLRESPRSFTGQVILTGNHSTREDLIQREVEIASGDPLSLDRILATASNLYNLAVFNKVQVREVPSYRDPLQKNVMVNVEEAKRYNALVWYWLQLIRRSAGYFGPRQQ